MTVGPEVDAVFWSGPPIPVQQDPPPGAAMPMSSVADLVGQLAAGMDSAHAQAASAAASDPMMQQLPPEQLQQLLMQLTQAQLPQQIPTQMQMQQQPPQQPYGDWPGLNQFSADYSQPAAFQDDGGERNGWAAGRGGRGRGRGRGRGGAGNDDGYRHNKRRLCNFFAAGRRAQNQTSKLRPKTDYASVTDASTETNATIATISCQDLIEASTIRIYVMPQMRLVIGAWGI